MKIYLTAGLDEHDKVREIRLSQVCRQKSKSKKRQLMEIDLGEQLTRVKKAKQPIFLGFLTEHEAHENPVIAASCESFKSVRPIMDSGRIKERVDCPEDGWFYYKLS